MERDDEFMRRDPQDFYNRNGQRRLLQWSDYGAERLYGKTDRACRRKYPGAGSHRFWHHGWHRLVEQQHDYCVFIRLGNDGSPNLAEWLPYGDAG